jgi:hypothetical protein
MTLLQILRLYKIGPFAIFDTAISYLGIFILSPLLSGLFALIKIKVPWYSWLWLTLPIAVLFHIIFHQSTPMMGILAHPEHLNFYLVTISLLFMTYMGFKNIHRIKY